MWFGMEMCGLCAACVGVEMTQRVTNTGRRARLSGQMSALLDGNVEGRVWECPVYVQYVGACVAHALQLRVHTTDEMADQAIGPCDSFFGWTILDGFLFDCGWTV